MKKISELMPEAYDFNGKLPLKQAIPLGLQHVMAMFVGNLTPLLIITGACGIGAGLVQEVNMHLFRLHFYRMR
ncbi:MAG: hypothetical protein BHW18_00295 [Eubacterium sp. 36_13]|nr:MAG: hypothetical protein BHW18_00295 [Eubacterium sp. 36_13]